MTSSPRRVRVWAGLGFGAAQLAAVAAGLLSWPAAAITLLLTWLVVSLATPTIRYLAKSSQAAVLLLVLGVGVSVVRQSRAALGTGTLDPLTTLHALVLLLIVMSLVMAPAWRTLRDYRVWLGVAAGILIASAAPPQSSGHADLATAVLIGAWVVLLVGFAMVQRATIAERAIPTPTGLAAPVVVSVVAGALVFLALPGSLGGGGLSERLAHDLHRTPVASAAATRTTAGVDTIGSGDLDLLVRGSLPDTPLLRVPARSPALWRATVYSTYTGQSWQSSGYPAFPFTVVRGSRVTLPHVAAAARREGWIRRRYVVTPQQVSGFSLVWAPGELLRVSGPHVTEVAEGSAFTRLASFPPTAAPYAVTVAVPPQSPSRLRSVRAVATSDGVWTALPAGLPSRIAALARTVTRGATTRYQQVTDLESYLRSHETYSLSSPVPTGRQDAVDDFLFRDHVGFCEQFASAEAVMLRTLGVPARVVSGLAYGTREGSTRLLRAKNAHAWVEVHYPGIGWVPTDPTAGVSLAPASAPARSWWSSALHRLADTVPGGGLGILLALIAIVAAGTAVRRAAGQRRRTPGPTGPETAPRGRPVLAAFSRFAGRHPVATPRAPSETAREFVARAAPGGRLGHAVATLESESYGPEVPDDDQVLAAVTAFDAAEH